MSIELLGILLLLFYLRYHCPLIITYKLTHPDARKPDRAYHRAACFDVYAVEEVFIKSGEWREVEIGASFASWPHFYIPWFNITCTPLGNVAMRIHTRSGLALKKGLRAHLGVIDNDYRKPLTVLLFNSNYPFPVHIHKGDKVAQVEFYRVPSVWMVGVKKLSKSLRGEQGFGSTGQ